MWKMLHFKDQEPEDHLFLAHDFSSGREVPIVRKALPATWVLGKGNDEERVVASARRK